MKTLLSFVLLCMGFSYATAQRTVYLDKDARVTDDKSVAVEYAVIKQLPDTHLNEISFYTMSDKLLRISQYSSFADVPEERVLQGRTVYKFRDSEVDSMNCFYRNNLRQGGANYYHADGKVKVKCTYKEGLLNGLLLEYFPDGVIRRKDLYEKGVAIGSNLYNEEGENIGNSPYYYAPAPEMGLQGLMDTLSYEVKMPNDIWTKAGDWVIYLEAHFDDTGKFLGVECVQTNYKPLVTPAVKKVTRIMESLSFQPAMMDKQPVSGSIVFPLKYKVELVKPSEQTNKEEPIKEKVVAIRPLEMEAYTEKILLDKDSNQTTNPDEAVEYILMTYEDLEKVKVEFYTMQDVLKERTYYQNFSWKKRDLGREGASTVFYADGKDSLVCNYRNNKRVGKYTTYYPNGQVNLVRELEYNGRTKRLKQYHPNGNLKRIEEPGQDKLYYDEYGTQIIPYVPFEQKSSMVIPQKVFMIMLGKELKYPSDAQKRKVQGKVVLQLRISPSGDATEAWVARSLDPSLDKEAHRAVSKLMENIKFHPAYEDGNPVESVFTLPVTFRLNVYQKTVVRKVGTRVREF